MGPASGARANSTSRESLGHVHTNRVSAQPRCLQSRRRLGGNRRRQCRIELARTASRHGCEEVTVICNLDEAASRRARSSRVRQNRRASICLMKSAVEITDEGVIWPTRNNRGRRFRYAKDTGPKRCSADSIIVAISQGPARLSFLDQGMRSGTAA